MNKPCLLSILTMLACLPLQAQRQSISLIPNAWEINATQTLNVPITLNNAGLPGGRFILQFTFPDNSTGDWAKYLSTIAIQTPSLGQSVYVAGNVIVTCADGTTTCVTFNYDSEVFNTCVSPATTRIYISSELTWGPYLDPNYDYIYSGPNFGDRWFSNPASFILQNGSFSFSIPLTDGNWTDVYGNTPADLIANGYDGFSYTLNNPTFIGMVFGGGCFFGHGVNTTGGTATFQITSFYIQ